MLFFFHGLFFKRHSIRVLYTCYVSHYQDVRSGCTRWTRNVSVYQVVLRTTGSRYGRRYRTVSGIAGAVVAVVDIARHDDCLGWLTGGTCKKFGKVIGEQL